MKRHCLGSSHNFDYSKAKTERYTLVFKLLIAIFIDFLNPVILTAAPLCNFNDDSASDVVLVDGSDITIRSLSRPSEKSQNFELDLSSDITFLAPARSGRYTSLEAIRYSDGSELLSWRRFNKNVRELRSFGEPGHTFIIGGNVNKNPWGDVIEIYPEERTLRWRIFTDMFGPSARIQKPITFGNVGDRVFLSRFGSRSHQRLGVFGPLPKSKIHARLKILNLQTGRSINFRSFPLSLALGERPRPMSIKDHKGQEALLFSTTNETDTILSIYSIRGKKLARIIVPQKGEVLVGEYNADRKGEEIAIYNNEATSDQITVISPFNGTRIVSVTTQTEKGKALPCLAVLRIPDVAPTPTPSPTATAISTTLPKIRNQ